MTRSERNMGRAGEWTLLRLAVAAVAASVAASCAEGLEDLSPEPRGTLSMDGERGAGSFQSVAIQVPVDVREGEAGEAEQAISAVRGGAPAVIYLNRRGGTFRGGADDSGANASSVVSYQGLSQATIPPYAGGDANWSSIVTCLQNMFSRFNVTVTDVEPAPGTEYVESVFGGRASALRMPSNVGGVAPIDLRRCSSIWRAVVYTFTDALGSNPQVACEVAAQEIAHAYSLEHELLASDPMTYLPYSGRREFQDQAARCGEYASAPRACSCGRGTQNSVALLTQILGAASGGSMPPPMMPPPMMPPPGGDTTAPTVSITSPAEGATLPGGTGLRITATATDDRGVASVELLWRYNNVTLACPGSGPGWSCTAAGSEYTWTLNVGTGDRTFQVKARDAAGNVTESAVRAIRLGTSGGAMTPPPPTDRSTTITVAQPTAGARVGVGQLLGVAADVRDPDGVVQVTLIWRGPTGESTRALGTETGDRWSTTLQVAPSAVPGGRTVVVQATDRLGNTTSSAPVPIEITP